ncbi:MAG: Stp1/IreP family PP2C-type Ser/Thr phosphatase, partial [Dehalococcoidia bacterium]|nr:Stp1/IreP family PP2C-type Ser/Thr phosphatase [Dehalococcoidia bacterium]
MARTIAIAGSRVDTGLQRDHNEDNLGCRQSTNDDEALARGDLFVVADGMGGHAAGEVASEIAVDTIIASYYASVLDGVATMLTNSIKLANQLIYDRAAGNDALRGMGTTCVCCVIHGDTLYTAHVGDSRVYLCRDGGLTRITTDHSWVEEQVKQGILSAEETRIHPMRNVITRALGSAQDVEVDLSVRDVQEDDILLMCSDGLTTAVTDEAIATVLATIVGPQAIVDALVDLANSAGGPDNIGIIAVCLEKVVSITGDDGGESPT